jgi:hypothetical protein
VYPNVSEIRRKDNPMNNDVAQISELGKCWVEAELVADTAGNELTDLVDGARTAVTAHADWAEIAHLVAEELRAHLPSPDVLTAEQRLARPTTPPGYIDRVRNTNETTAISIDIYGTDLTRIGSSVRRYYD